MAEGRTRAVVAHALRMSGIESRLLDGGERLVGFGFRCWLSGYRAGNVCCWQRCWDDFCLELGSGKARSAVMDLSNWVNAVRCSALREIELLPPECPSFCRDECLAVTLVAASEHHACPAIKVCAQLLLGAADIEAVLSAAHSLKSTLETCGILLKSDLISSDPSSRLH
jgi:hypothetical protein